MNIQLDNYSTINCQYPSGTTSKKYVFVPTMDAIDVLNSQGWGVVDVKETKVRDGRNTSKHFVSFENPDFNSNYASSKGMRPRVMITNSHDGTSSFRMHMGIFRLICSNGMIVGSRRETARTPHIHTYKEEILKTLVAATEEFNPVYDQISRWSNTFITPVEATNLSRKMSSLRWDDPSDFVVSNMLQSRRNEDNEQDLWTITNKIQENLIKGGVRGDKRRVRSVSNIDSLVGINKGIWDITEDFYQELMAA